MMWTEYIQQYKNELSYKGYKFYSRENWWGDFDH